VVVVVVVKVSKSRTAVAETWGQFRNPEEGDHLLLEVASSEHLNVL
jgi:hypothetical protein